MTAAEREELERMREWTDTHSTVSAAHMCRRVELERMDAAEQATEQERTRRCVVVSDELYDIAGGNG